MDEVKLRGKGEKEKRIEERGLVRGIKMAEAFANDACRTVAAQVSEAVGFHAMTVSTADTLAEVLARYIEEVGYQSHSLTEASNRTHDNALDVRQSLLQCGTSLSELIRFMQRNELRYAKAEQPFPVQRPLPKTSLAARFGAEQGEKRLPHMPDFLPDLPPRHSYLSTMKQARPQKDARALKKSKHKERLQIEQSLHKMAASASGKSAKKRSEGVVYGAQLPEEATDGGAAASAAHVTALQEQEAVLLNDTLAEAAEGLRTAPLPPLAAVDAETEALAKAREYRLSLPSKEALTFKETDNLGEDRDKERDKKRQKATRILSTQHNIPPEEEAGRGGDAGAARSPARSPLMDEMEDVE